MYTHTAETQATVTPARALEFLMDGNQRFLANLRANRDLRAQQKSTSDGQWPFAVILGCIDSRVPAELVFDQGIGDIFSVRIAGNCITNEILGSLEFSCKVAGAKLVVVMGHSHCGAIKGACDDVKLGNVTSLMDKLKPSVKATTEPTASSARNSSNPAFVQAVAVNNVHGMRKRLLEESDVLREMRDSGQIDVVSAMYDIETGVVELLDAVVA